MSSALAVVALIVLGGLALWSIKRQRETSSV